MLFRRYFVVILSCFVGLGALFWISKQHAQTQELLDWRVELQQINEELENAEELKDRYLSEAARAEDEGMRWQFQQNEKQEARRAFQKADAKKQAAQMMQSRIDELKARKAEILQEHPEANEF